MKKNNIVLIGMPGSGKSTVGVILAKTMGMDFIDTDLLIQLSKKRTLQEIVDSDGHMALRAIEEKILLGLHKSHHVIATGGSAAYSHKAMTHLKNHGTIIFLDADLDCLRRRIHNYETRGLAKRPDQTFADLFAERYELYCRYADLRIACCTMNQEETCVEIQKYYTQLLNTIR